MKPEQTPGPRTPARGKFDLHISVPEETDNFLREIAEHYARPKNKQVVLVIEAIVSVQRASDPTARDVLDHLLRHPGQLGAHLQPLLAFRASLDARGREAFDHLLKQPDELSLRLSRLLATAP